MAKVEKRELPFVPVETLAVVLGRIGGDLMKTPKRPKRPIPTRDPLKDAKFQYVSTCCGEIAKKTPCVAANKITGTYIGAKPEAEGTLGSWRCSKCGKPCKCQRHVKKEENAAVVG